MKINKHNKKYSSKIGTNLLDIKTIDKTNLSKVVGQWLAVQSKEINNLTKDR